MSLQEDLGITAEQPYTPEWWRDRLSAQLDLQITDVDRVSRYYDGRNTGPDFGTPLWQDAFRGMFKDFSDNWLGLVVDSSVERLRVQGFRFGDSTDADEDAWKIWQFNNLDLESRIAHTEAIKTGSAYLLISPPENPGDPARITVEHPAQCIVARDPGDHRSRLAGLKRWTDDTGRAFATLYTRHSIFRWQTQDAWSLGGLAVKWELRDDGGELANPLGDVPLIPLENNPSLLGGGRSDILGLIPIQDAVNKILADAIVASEYSALPQRYGTGLELPKNAAGEVDRSLAVEATFKRMWVSESPDAKWGEFSVAQLDGYVALTRELIQHLAAVSKTPPHYLLGQIVNASGDALKTAEAGLVSKVKAKQVDFSEPWEDAMRAAFLLAGDQTRGTASDAQTLWADPESRTEAELVDAMTKQVSIGIPEQIAWEKLGYSPAEIERILELKQDEQDSMPAMGSIPPPMLAVVPDNEPPPQGVNRSG